MSDKQTGRFFYVLLIELFVFFMLVLFMKAEKLIYNILVIVLFGAGALLTVNIEKLMESISAAFTGFRKESLVLSVVLVIILPFFFLRSAYIIHVLTFALIYIIAALGLNFQVGGCGMVSFAQSTFLGIGGYTSALLAVNLGISFWLGLPAAVITTGVFGLILGWPSLKTKSFYLALVSIAFCYIAFLMVHNMEWTGGPDGIPGIPKPVFFGYSFAKMVKVGSINIPGGVFYYYLVLLIVIIAIVLSWRFRNSWLGLAWNALKEDEIASKCYGINLTLYKLLAFLLGSVFAGIAGVLYAHFVGFISPENMTFAIGLLFVSMIILGGADNITGVVAGAFLLVIIPEKFRAFQDFRLMFYGLILIVMLLFRRQGLIPAGTRRYRLKEEMKEESRR
ncbi:MAG: branched-chain amino acid ABC transporter permease [Spirochaetes bacterium]|nr:MAG: branched-chain amino acid ABC transporter permease [Spirochaetota bacterium]